MRFFPALFPRLLRSRCIQRVKEIVARWDWDLQSLSRFLFRLARTDKRFLFSGHSTPIVSAMIGSRPNHELALRRAHHHLEEIEREVGNWVNSDRHRVSHEFNRETSEYIVWVETDPPDRDPISMLTSDCLHNLYSGLNFLAYELSLSFTNPLPDEIAEECAFPIFGDKDRQGGTGVGPRLFQGSGKKRIEGMDPRAQTIIEGLQPYQRGAAYVDDPLWLLYELSRIGRHRFLYPAAAFSLGFAMSRGTRNVASMGPGIIHSYGGLIEGRTQVARLPITPIDPSQDVHMDITPVLGISFARGTPLVAEKPLVDTLATIYNHIVTKVLPPLRLYLTET